MHLTKLLPLLTLLTPLTYTTPAPFPQKRAATVQGFDISHYQPTVDFNAAYLSGARFVIIKATEGKSVIDPQFANHWSQSSSAHFLHGAYHFAHPDQGSGADQANFFLQHGGKWTNDGVTLPGMLDIEYNPKKGANSCYGLSQQAMVQWVGDFSNAYQQGAGRAPGIYTTADWWRTCTGNSNAFAGKNPLWLARYSSSVGTMPGGWSTEAIWQNSRKYQYGGDGDLFNGDENALKALASPNNTQKAIAPKVGTTVTGNSPPGNKVRREWGMANLGA